MKKYQPSIDELKNYLIEASNSFPIDPQKTKK